jgi:hypothetical protein
MLLDDDVVTDGQAKPSALSSRLVGKKGLNIFSLWRSYTRSPSSGCDDPMFAQSAVRAAPVDIQSASYRSDTNSRPK